MRAFFNRLREVFADRRGAPRAGGEYAVELIVGITDCGSPTTLFTHTLDVSRGGLSVFVPRVEAAPLLTGGETALSLTLTLPRGPVRMLAAPRHVRPLKEGPMPERGYAVGFEILEMAASDRVAYGSFVKTLSHRP